MMTKVAKVRAHQGNLTGAVELLASVLVEPTSTRQPFTDSTPINEAATTLLSDLETKLDPEVYAAAYAKGAACPYDVAVRQLFKNIP